MQNIDPSLLQELLHNNSGGSNPTISLLPESFINLLIIGFITLNIVAVLFLVVYIIGMVRKWKVQSAVLTMQQDVRELKESLVTSKNEPKS